MDTELTEEQKKLLRGRQEELIKLLDAISKISSSKEWAVLKEIIFDKSLTSIEKQILNEGQAKEINTSRIYRLQGEWLWAKHYSDMERFAEGLKLELQNIKNKLK
jgi:hypothetical protein